VILRSDEGYLILAGREHPVHRCETLSKQTEADLLIEGDQMLREPPIE
jgi:hypothetical protein